MYLVLRIRYGESGKLQKLQVVKYVHKNRIGIITEKQLYKGHKLGFAKYIKLRVINIFWEIYDEKGCFICWEYYLFAIHTHT